MSSGDRKQLGLCFAPLERGGSFGGRSINNTPLRGRGRLSRLACARGFRHSFLFKTNCGK
jgi:hypothetical protein